MQKCPNCGQATARTEDWACQWCGYPLLSRAYKKIPQTYKQLKEERLRELEPLVSEEAEALEAEPELEPVVEPEPEPVLESEPEPAPKAKRKPVTKAKRKPVTKAKRKPVTKAKRKPATESEPEPVPESEPELVLESEPEPVPESEPEPMPAAIEVTVEELLSAYEADVVAADAKFVNKIVKVTGVVDKIEVKDILDIYYITLASAEKKLLQHVRCMFDKKHGSELNQLTTGQTVTVQGKYDGSIINMRIKDCVLVR